MTPITIGPANAEQATGLPWRYLRDRYGHLLRRAGERKAVILASELARELGGREARATRDDETDVDALAAELGVERGAR